jgi:hypothetical protein
MSIFAMRVEENTMPGLIPALRSANLAFERRLIDLRFRAP